MAKYMGITVDEWVADQLEHSMKRRGLTNKSSAAQEAIIKGLRVIEEEQLSVQ